MLRNFITKVFPNLGARLEKESREWMIQCQNCQHEVSVWDAGGIRYKARGTVRRLGKCSRCGKTSLLRIYHPDKSQGSNAT